VGGGVLKGSNVGERRRRPGGRGSGVLTTEHGEVAVQELVGLLVLLDLLLEVRNVVDSLGEDLPLGGLHAAVGRKSLAELIKEVAHLLTALTLGELVTHTELGRTREGKVLLDGSLIVRRGERVDWRGGDVGLKSRGDGGKSLGLETDLGSVNRRADLGKCRVNVHLVASRSHCGRVKLGRDRSEGQIVVYVVLPVNRRVRVIVARFLLYIQPVRETTNRLGTGVRVVGR
jgi:hypothetical protein